MTVIKDGTGQGYLAQVDKDYRLFARAINVDRMSWHSEEFADTYSIHMHHQQTVGATWEPCGYITYTGAKTLLIGNVLGNVEATSGMSGFTFYFDSTTFSGGAVVTPVNMNRSSTKNISSITIMHNNDGASPITVGNIGTNFACFSIPPSSSVNFDFRDSVILRTGNTLYVAANTATAGAAQGKMRLTFFAIER